MNKLSERSGNCSRCGEGPVQFKQRQMSPSRDGWMAWLTMAVSFLLLCAWKKTHSNSPHWGHSLFLRASYTVVSKPPIDSCYPRTDVAQQRERLRTVRSSVSSVLIFDEICAVLQTVLDMQLFEAGSLSLQVRHL